MYFIRYVDPITGLSFEFKAEKLENIIEAVQKAKDDFYYRGFSIPEKASSEKDEVKEKTTVETELILDERENPPQESEMDFDDDEGYGYWF